MAVGWDPKLKEARAQAALRLLASSHDAVRQLDSWTWAVPSERGAGHYIVRLDRKTGAMLCECVDYAKKGRVCKHIWAITLMDRQHLDWPEPAKPPRYVMLDLTPECPCGSRNVVQKGKRKCLKGEVQRWGCKDCGKRFTNDLGFNRLKATGQTVSAAYQLYCTGLSYREVAFFLTQHMGVSISKSTIERWVHATRAKLTAYEATQRPQVGPFWHADETTIPLRVEPSTLEDGELAAEA